MQDELDELDEFFEELEEETEEPEEETPEETKKELATLLKEESEPEPKEVFMYFGDKGHGKTVQALGHDGEIAVLSFDGKSMKVKKKWYKNDARIHVFNINKLVDFFVCPLRMFY